MHNFFYLLYNYIKSRIYYTYSLQKKDLYPCFKNAAIVLESAGIGPFELYRFLALVLNRRNRLSWAILVFEKHQYRSKRFCEPIPAFFTTKGYLIIYIF